MNSEENELEIQKKRECRVLRILWRSKYEDKIGVYEYTKHVFGCKSSPTCASSILLQAGLDNKKSHPLAAKANERSFYMDDVAKSVATKEDAVRVHSQMTLQIGGFNLLQWICNNEVVTRSSPEKDGSDENCKTFEAEPHTSSLLRMQWKVDIDTLEVFHGADKEIFNTITQRAVFSFVASALCTVHDEKAHPTEYKLGQKWKTVRWKTWSEGRRGIPWLGQRTRGIEKHASEGTLFWQKLQENRFAYLL